MNVSNRPVVKKLIRSYNARVNIWQQDSTLANPNLHHFQQELYAHDWGHWVLLTDKMDQKRLQIQVTETWIIAIRALALWFSSLTSIAEILKRKQDWHYLWLFSLWDCWCDLKMSLTRPKLRVSAKRSSTPGSKTLGNPPRKTKSLALSIWCK